MAHFTVYKNKNPSSKSTYPLLVDAQADLLDDLQTRQVIPLTKAPALTKTHCPSDAVHRNRRRAIPADDAPNWPASRARTWGPRSATSLIKEARSSRR